METAIGFSQRIYFTPIEAAKHTYVQWLGEVDAIKYDPGLTSEVLPNERNFFLQRLIILVLKNSL
jgi:hypothetical protein